MQNWDIERPDAEWYALGDHRLDGLVREVMDRPALAIDTETTGLNIAKDIPLFWSIAWDGRRIAMPAATLPFFKKAFSDANKTWVLHNAKYDAHILANVGIDIRGRMLDTKVMHALLYEDQSHRLKDVALGVMGWKWQDFRDTFGTPNARKGETIQSILLRCYEQDLPKLVDYAANDAYGTWHIYQALDRELGATPTHSLYPHWIDTLGDLFHKVEVPFTRVLWNCERRGVVIDTGYLAGIEDAVKKGIAQSERRLAALIGRVINLNSPQQLSALFFKEYGVRPPKITKSGGASTDEETLEWIAAGDNEKAAQVALQILDHRGLVKLYKTYVLGLGESVDTHGRIHTTLNQDVARTGRLSSSDPNLQNIPRPDNDTYRIRAAFTCEPGQNLIVGDYEQLEMRLLASAALEPDMINIFLSGKDIHMGNAELVFGIPYDDLKTAKKIDKEIKEGKRSADDLNLVMSGGMSVSACLDARNDIKTIGFGKPECQAEVKLPQNGEVFAARAA